jgi:hypothetical protein
MSIFPSGIHVDCRRPFPRKKWCNFRLAGQPSRTREFAFETLQDAPTNGRLALPPSQSIGQSWPVYRNSFRLHPGSRESTALRFDSYDLRGRLMRPGSFRMRNTAKVAYGAPKFTVCESFHLSD